MSRSTCRVSARAAAGFLTLLAASPALPADLPRFSAAISLAEDLATTKRLKAARGCIAGENWREAVEILQSVLDAEQDVFVPVRRRGKDGKDRVVRASARAEAGRLVADLPPKARELYRLTYGPTAAEFVADARKSGRTRGLLEVVRRFRYTDAGAEAVRLLATHHLDRGHFPLATRYFRMALDGDRPAPLLCFQAALAFRRCGDKADADWAWKLLSARAPNGLRLGRRLLSLEELRKRLERFSSASRSASAAAADWMMFRGDSTRAAQSAGPLPLLEKRWTRASAREGDTRAWLRKAQQPRTDSVRATLPASFPLLIGDRLIYRSHRGVVAADCSSGDVLWEAPSAWALDSLAADVDSYPHVSDWADAHLGRNPYLLVENSVLGTLSADRGRVYAVDDLPFPPVPASAGGFRAGQRLPFAEELTEAVYHNRLLAIDLRSGKVAWQRGGRAAGDPLRDSFFLGPPLPLDGRLYALVEGEEELSLVCLGAARGEVRWMQKLAVPQTKLLLDGARRTYAAPLAHAEGVLVCPTNAGAVVAVDLLTRELLWAHAYRKQKPPPVAPEMPRAWRRRGRFLPLAPVGPLPDKHWRASSPLSHRGKVVFTAPDEESVQCLDLHTGELRWRAEFAEGLFVAATGDRVLLVGSKNSRAVRLDNGKEVWNLATGEPVGEGVLAGTVYHLPIRAGDKNRPAVLAIDVSKGTIVGKTPWPSGDAPGNLLFVKGEVFAQTATAVTSYARGKPVPRPRAAPAAKKQRLSVAQLGSHHYEQREAADRALRAAGVPALKALRQATRSPDAEIRRRAARLVRRIEKDALTARLLTPGRVRLICKDTPLFEAVADLARESNMPLTLKAHLAAARREVTLDTGEVPFWEALDRLCAKAGLVEPPPAAPVTGGGRSVVIMGGRRGRPVQPRDILRPEAAAQPESLVLKPGKRLPLPTHCAGSVRIQALPPEAASSDPAKAGEVQLTLVGRAGPRLVWDRAVGLRIHKALDDKGQPLEPVPAALQTDNTGSAGAAVFINRVPIRAPDDRSRPRIPVRLERGAKPSKLLKELTGTVFARVRMPAEVLVVVEDVFKAVGKTVKGPHGGAVRVVEVKREADGTIRLRLQVEAPSAAVDDTPLPFNATIIIDGKPLGQPREPLSAENFGLRDRKGKPLPVVKAVNTGVSAGAAQEVELTYRAEGKVTAAKFVYSGRRTTVIEVPFRLKDIPLP